MKNVTVKKKSKNNIDVSVIIVSYNTKLYTLKAIQAVYAAMHRRQCEVIVVENMSTDGSYEAIVSSFRDVRVVKTRSLLGFSAANNLGAQSASGRHLFFLNPDTEVFDGAIDILVDALEKNSTRGAVSGQLVNTDHSIQPQGGALPTLWNICLWMFFLDDIPGVNTILLPYQQRNITYFTQVHMHGGWVGGTALMIPREVFDAIGGWDENIHLYAEDVEICARIHKEQKFVAYVPLAKILHHQHISVGGPMHSQVGEIENLIYYWKKHKQGWEIPCVRVILFLGSWLRIILFGILMRDEARKHTYMEAQRRIFIT
ncbi:MAG: glycosyltransferase family 2 protein [Candidatus Pacebacteria bacterium]|nr:glycosyltransferase family 2 protein [Candidatus Paceibacterota bacterium]